MEIVHEVNQLDFGGVEKVVRNIIKYDKKNTHTIIAYEDGKFRKNLEEVGAKILMAPKDGETDLDIAADVIHIHSGGGLSQLAADVNGSFPVIETIHSPIRSPIPSKLISRRVGVCEAVARKNSNAIFIRNGIEVEDPTRPREEMLAELGIPAGVPVVGRLGRLGYDKGLEEWLLACYYLQKKGFNFVPLIVGDEARDAKGYRGNLKLIAESLPVKNVIFVENKEDISNYLQLMDVFLYPSATEGFGLVIAEAIYNECVVVAYKNEVSMELFAGYALLADKERGIPELVRLVEHALYDSNIQDEVKGIGPAFIQSEYDAERMSLEYQELYESCHADFIRKNKPQAVDVVSA